MRFSSYIILSTTFATHVITAANVPLPNNATEWRFTSMATGPWSGSSTSQSRTSTFPNHAGPGVLETVSMDTRSRTFSWQSWNESLHAGTIQTTSGTGDSNTPGNIDGQSVSYLAFDGTTSSAGSYRVKANTGLNTVSDYTLIYDVFVADNNSSSFLNLVQTDTDNSSDGDYFLRPTNEGLWVAGPAYINGPIWNKGQWQRLAIVVDGTADTAKLYINGTLSHTANGFTRDLHANTTPFWILSDNNGEHSAGNLSAFAFIPSQLPTADITGLGGVKAEGIFGVGINGAPESLSGTLDPDAGTVTLNWTAATNELTADAIQVLRNGTVIATLAKTASSYVDSPTPPSTSSVTYNYTVRATQSGTPVPDAQTATTVIWSPNGLITDLVAYYRFENGYEDTSGSTHTHNGTANGPITRAGGGVYGHAITFLDQSSTGQYVNLGNHADFNFGSSTDFTISLWFKREGTAEDNSSLGGGPTDAAIISNKNWGSGSNAGWGIFMSSDGGIKWNIASPRKDVTIASGFGGDGVADGQWHHLVITHDRDGSARFYLDGNLKSSTSLSGVGNLDTGLPIVLGADGNFNYRWRGSMDEVAIWRRAIDAEEVASLYTDTLSGKSITRKSIIDSDNDDLDDAWEITTFGNLNQTKHGDFDNDGRSNFLEYSLGTDATSAAAGINTEAGIIELNNQSYPTISYTRPALNGDVSYILEASSTLQPNSWESGDDKFIPIGNPINLIGGLKKYTLRHYLPINPSSPRRLFRVRISSRYQAAINEDINPTVEFRNGKAYIRWTTATPSATILDWGTSGTASTRYEDYTLKTSHEVVISDIQPGDILAYTVVHLENGIETRSHTFTSSRYWDYSPPPLPDQAGYQTGGNWAAHAAGILALPNAPDRGYCLDFRCGGGKLAYELTRQSSLVIIAVEDTQAEVDAARAFLTARGVYGSRVTVILANDLNNLPFRKNTFNLAVSGEHFNGSGQTLTALNTAVQNYVKPGRGMVAGDDSGYTSITKPNATGTGTYTHQYANIANTGSTTDELGNKKHIDDFGLQWIGRPGPEIIIDRMVRAPAPLAANGRMYCQGMGRILGLDSHNGTILWTREIRDLRRLNMLRDAGNMAADNDALWLAVHGECWKLAGDDGALTTFSVQNGPRNDFDYAWGYVGRTGNHLLGSATKSDAFYKKYWSQSAWFDAQSGSETYQVVSDNIFSLNKDTGTLNWNYEDGLILNATITVANGKVFFLECRDAGAIAGNSRRLSKTSWKSNVKLVCLNLADGTKLWETTPSFSGGEPVVWLQYADSKLILSTSRHNDDRFYIYALDPSNGSQLWTQNHAWRSSHHGGNHQHPVIRDGKIYLEPNAYNLSNGSIAATNMPSRSGCSTFVGSKHLLFFRGLAQSGQYAGNIALWDPATGTSSSVTRVRPSCWISWAPANGMLLVHEQSSGCSCGSWMHTSFGLSPNN